MDSVLELTEEKESNLKMKKYLLKPTAKQKKLLRKWFGTARWTWNQCLAATKEDVKKATLKYLRPTHINIINYENKNEWVKETPYEIRDQAMISLLSAYKSNFTSMKQKLITDFNIKFQSKKSKSQVIHILKKCFTSKGICPRSGFGVLKGYEELPKKPDYDSKLLYENGKYWLLVPMPIELTDRTKMDDLRVVAIDPGTLSRYF